MHIGWADGALKIRLDENLSPRVAKAVLALTENREGFEVSHVRQMHGPGTDDPDWMSAFVREGGTAIIWGDYNILRNWPNLIAYKESGLIGLFPPPAFNGLVGYAKAALLIRWWPAILERVQLSSPGDTWRIPLHWTPNVKAFKLLEDPRFGNGGKIGSISGRSARRTRPRSKR